ncbi:MAG: Transcription factor WhiB, partial [Actinomycetota bacterium]|nr:Transcription factor WhiB [Actinomycetota bacterium]
RGTDLDLWYSTGAANIDTARGYCRGCPVLGLCREDALTAEDGLPASKRHGTRAGLTPAERAAAPVLAGTPEHAHG